MGKKIAVTGGIGSGKSTVLSILKTEGYPVFSCDELYKSIVTTQEYINLIAKHFPTCIVGNELDKTRLSAIVFKDKTKLALLNSLAHPLIMCDLMKKMNQTENELSFAEVPLLFEGNYQTLFDAVFVVMRNRENRIQSVIERDAIQKEQVEDRISSQLNYEDITVQEKLKKDHIFILENNQDICALREKIKTLLKIIEN